MSEVMDTLRRGINHGRPRLRVGRPVWWAEMKRKVEARKVLKDLPTERLVEEEDLKVPAPVLRRIAESHSTIWDLSRASRTDLREIPGVGEATLTKIRTYLISKNVPVTW